MVTPLERFAGYYVIYTMFYFWVSCLGYPFFVENLLSFRVGFRVIIWSGLALRGPTSRVLAFTIGFRVSGDICRTLALSLRDLQTWIWMTL